MRPWGTVLRRYRDDLSGFGLTWLVQSSVLLALGLLAGRLLRRSGPAVQSGVYRTTLVAVLVCPFASAALSAAGFDGLSLRLPSPVTPSRARATFRRAATPPRSSVAAESNMPVATLRESQAKIARMSMHRGSGRSDADASRHPRRPWRARRSSLSPRGDCGDRPGGLAARVDVHGDCGCGWVRPGCARCGRRLFRPSRGQRRSAATSRGR